MEVYQPHRYSALLCSLSLICGCAVSSVTERATAFRLPPPKLAPDSVVLEVAQVSVPADDPAWTDRLWSQLDEQVLSTEVRRALSANGLRVGLAGSRLPDEIYRILGQGEAGDQRHADVIGEPADEYQRIQLRSGKRSDIVMRDPLDQMVSFSAVDEAISGQSLASAQPQFSMFATPHGDGSTLIQLIPEVHHGTTKQKIVGDNGMFRFEPSRDKVAYDSLAIEADVHTGQTLVVTSSGPRHSIGGNFFQDDRDPAHRKLLLIRLAQSQADDLFGESL